MWIIPTRSVRNRKLFADPAAVRARKARLHEPHIADLTRLVERIRLDRGGGNSAPWFDPDSGGREAAQSGWDEYTGSPPSDLWVLRCPHPSPVNLRTRPDTREEILDAFTEAA